MESDPQHSARPGAGKTFALALLVAVLSMAVYSPALNGEFVWDDQHYISGNPHIQRLSGETLGWAFTDSYVGNWHPLTWLSHALDVRLFGAKTRGHHAVSILFHGLNSALLLLVLLRLTGRLGPSVGVALLFGLHPLHVESVAWITGRKDVLSMFFFVLALHAYVTWARERKLWAWIATIVAFAFGLASKPMLVTFPFVLLLLDFWPLRRLDIRAVIEKLPLFVLSLVSSVITVVSQAADASLTSLQVIGVAMRVQNALVAYVRYLFKIAWPTSLYPYYPYPSLDADAFTFLALPGAIALLGVISWYVWREKESRGYLVTGWLFFIGTLVPVIGLVQVGRQSMADRYAYIPVIGIFLALVWAVDEALARLAPDARRLLGAALLVVAALPLGYLTWQQAKIWRSSESLWTHAVEIAPRSAITRFNLGNALARRGDFDGALEQFRIVVSESADPLDIGRARYQSAMTLKRQNRIADALTELDAAVEQTPDRVDILGARANTLFQLGRLPDAETAYRSALAGKGSPADFAQVQRDYAALLLASGRTEEAVEACRRAVELSPLPSSFEALAITLVRAGRRTEAVEALERGLARWPGNAVLSGRLGQLRAIP